MLVGPLGWVLVLFLPKSGEVEAVEAQRRTRLEAVSVSAPAMAEANLARLDQLERLHGLMQSGALTADEYNAEKGRLLAEQPASTPARPADAILSRGWYQDPEKPKMKRYYNGYNWTEKLRQYHFWESI